MQCSYPSFSPKFVKASCWYSLLSRNLRIMDGKKMVCVTGGNGFIASNLIKQLLAKGYAVNATVRDPDNLAKISHLKELQGLGDLKIFRADLTEEGSFDEAVSGCEYVFLVAAPVNLTTENPEKELIKPAIEGTLNVMKSCVKASVTRIILTSSASTVSSGQHEGTGHVLDEESWSDINYLRDKKPPTWGYAVSRVLAEKEACKFAKENNMSLVTVNSTLAVGPSLNPESKNSLSFSLSLLLGNPDLINILVIMQTISGSISMTHVEDVCRAHIFVAESASASGRYICCSVNTNVPDLANFLAERYPQYQVDTKFRNFPEKNKAILSSEKLVREGFQYKYKKIEEIYDDTIEYAKAIGMLP